MIRRIHIALWLLVWVPVLNADSRNLSPRHSQETPLEAAYSPEALKPEPLLAAQNLRDAAAILRDMAGYRRHKDTERDALLLAAGLIELYCFNSDDRGLREDPLAGSQKLEEALTLVRGIRNGEILISDDRSFLELKDGKGRAWEILRDYLLKRVEKERNKGRAKSATRKEQRVGVARSPSEPVRFEVKSDDKLEAFSNALRRSSTISDLLEFPAKPSVPGVAEFWRATKHLPPNAWADEVALLKGYEQFADSQKRHQLTNLQDALRAAGLLRDVLQAPGINREVADAVRHLALAKPLLDAASRRELVRRDQRPLSEIVRAAELGRFRSLFPKLEPNWVSFFLQLPLQSTESKAGPEEALIVALDLAERSLPPSGADTDKILVWLRRAAQLPKFQVRDYYPRLKDWLEQTSPTVLEDALNPHFQEGRRGAVTDELRNIVADLVADRVGGRLPATAVEAEKFFSPGQDQMLDLFRDRVLERLSKAHPGLLAHLADLAMDRVSPLVTEGADERQEEIRKSIGAALRWQPTLRTGLLVKELTGTAETEPTKGIELRPRDRAIATALGLARAAAWDRSILGELRSTAQALDRSKSSGQDHRVRNALRAKAARFLPVVGLDPQLDPEGEGRDVLAIASALDLEKEVLPVLRNGWQMRESELRRITDLGVLPALAGSSRWALLLAEANSPVAQPLRRGLLAQAYFEASTDPRRQGDWERIVKAYPSEAGAFLNDADRQRKRRPAEDSIATIYSRLDTLVGQSSAGAEPLGELLSQVEAAAARPGASMEMRYLRLVIGYRVKGVGELGSDWLLSDEALRAAAATPATAADANLIAGRVHFSRGPAEWSKAERCFAFARLGRTGPARSSRFLTPADIEMAREEQLIVLGEGVDRNRASEILQEFEHRLGPSPWSREAQVLDAAARAYAALERWPKAEQLLHQRRRADPASFDTGKWGELFQAWLAQQGRVSGRVLAGNLREWWRRLPTPPPPWGDLMATESWSDLEGRSTIADVRGWKMRDARTDDARDAAESAAVANIALRLQRLSGAGRVDGFGLPERTELFAMIAGNWAENNPVVPIDAGRKAWLGEWVARIGRMSNLDYTPEMAAALEEAVASARRAGDFRGAARLQLLVPSRSSDRARAEMQWERIVREPRLFGTIEFGAALELLSRPAGP